MRTTVDLPDTLFRRAKAEAALRGIKLKDLVLQALSQELDRRAEKGQGRRAKRRPTAHDLMKGCCGIVASGIEDLATHSKHMEGFGSDSSSHR
jgi:hypothetical protein